MSDNPAPAGLIDSARLLGSQLLATAQDRVVLLALELQEEKLRLTQLFLWAGLMIFAAMMTMTCLTLLAVSLWWESARVVLLAGLALFYGGATAALVVAFLRFQRRQPSPLAATLEELEADAKCIRPQS